MLRMLAAAPSSCPYFSIPDIVRNRARSFGNQVERDTPTILPLQYQPSRKLSSLHISLRATPLLYATLHKSEAVIVLEWPIYDFEAKQSNDFSLAHHSVFCFLDLMIQIDPSVHSLVDTTQSARSQPNWPISSPSLK